MSFKIAFVVQRCGKEVNGGAEAYCLSIAQKMSHIWDIEILTTCALDYLSWKDYYSEGVEEVNNVKIRRFKVDKERNLKSFNRISGKVLPHAKEVDLETSKEWMQEQGPLCSRLTTYIKENKDSYDRFFFFTYLYATTYYNLPLVKDKAILVPFAHDELPIYLPLWDEFYKSVNQIVFSTIEEKEFLQNRFPEAQLEGNTIGIGVDIPEDISNIRFRQKYNIYSPYILYIGRIDDSKGASELFSYFERFKDETQSNVKLVLAGKAVIKIPPRPDIVHLGFIDDQTKYDALSDCEFLVNPSPYESLSMVLLESWSLSRPVLVNGNCKVLAGQCERSSGGLSYFSYKDFRTHTEFLLKSGYTFKNMKKFIDKNYSWSVIQKKFEMLVN